MRVVGVVVRIEVYRFPHNYLSYSRSGFRGGGGFGG